MEVRILMRNATGAKATCATMNLIPEDQPWSHAAELGALSSIFDQDMANLPFVQEGLKASKTNEVNLGDYQEIRIRHFHATLDKYLARFS